MLKLKAQQVAAILRSMIPLSTRAEVPVTTLLSLPRRVKPHTMSSILQKNGLSVIAFPDEVMAVAAIEWVVQPCVLTPSVPIAKLT
jgi:hypothetical protein